VILKLIGIGEVVVLVNGRGFRRVFPAEDRHPPLELVGWVRTQEGSRTYRVFRFSFCKMYTTRYFYFPMSNVFYIYCYINWWVLFIFIREINSVDMYWQRLIFNDFRHNFYIYTSSFFLHAFNIFFIYLSPYHITYLLHLWYIKLLSYG